MVSLNLIRVEPEPDESIYADTPQLPSVRESPLEATIEVFSKIVSYV